MTGVRARAWRVGCVVLACLTTASCAVETVDAAGRRSGRVQASARSSAVAAPAPPKAPRVGPAAAVDPLSDTDRGITADDITVGIVTFKADTFASLGVNLSGKPLEDIARPFRDEINEHGGIAGHRVVLAITRYSPLIPADVQAACVEQAEDDRVFVTLASPGFGAPGEICLASKDTPVVTSNSSSADTLYNKTGGWVRQVSMSKDRVARNWVDWLVASGTATRATRIGIIHTDGPEDDALVSGVLIPYLRQKGLNVAVDVGFSGTTVDTVTAEAATTVLKLKTAGVDLVLPDLDFLRTYAFLAAAQNGGYKPRYSVSDLGQLSTDLTTFFYPAAQFAGTTGITAYVTGSRAANPAAEDCLRVYRAHGQELAADPAKAAVEFVQLLYVCEQLHLVATVAARAGPHLNRASFLAAFASLGPWSDRVTLTDPLTFGPDKFDGPDDYAVVRWEPGCPGAGSAAASVGCFRQVEPFRKGAW